MEKKETNLVITRIDEIEDDMSATLLNVAKVITQQKTLVEVVEKSSEKDKFKEFLEGTKADLEKKQKEYDTLLEHRNKLRALKTKLKFAQGKEKETMSDTLYEVFYIFNVITPDMLENAVGE